MFHPPSIAAIHWTNGPIPIINYTLEDSFLLDSIFTCVTLLETILYVVYTIFDHSTFNPHILLLFPRHGGELFRLAWMVYLFINSRILSKQLGGKRFGVTVGPSQLIEPHE